MAGCDETPLGRRLLDGDEAVLEILLREHGATVRAVLKQKFPGRLDHGDFEDVLAIALFRVWSRREQFDPDRGSLRAWFYRIAVNVTKDVLRYGWQKARQLEVRYEPRALSDVAVERSQQRGVGESLMATVAEPVLSSTDVSDDESLDERVRRVLRAIVDELPEAQRRIILADAASRDGKVSSEHLSQELGIPPGTVRVYRRRALARLRSELDLRGLTPQLNASPDDF
ncbi:sigma-70 family RNA polymerase sigma factor [bacterium]|nr:sigma-70 family RNA polymerase sigma factor [bacterium]